MQNAHFFVAASRITTVMAVFMSASVFADDMTFPHADWEQAAPESQGVDSAKLTAAIDALKAHTGRDGVRELVIVRNGRIIWRGEDIDKVHGVWSCTKSFTSTVAGLLIEDGKCTLDTQAAQFVPELEANYPGITLRHFTTMTSGYRAVRDATRGMPSHGQSRTPLNPATEPLFAPPGSEYAYWDSAMNMFALTLTRIAGESLEDVFRRRIAEPIGMNREKWRWGDLGERDGVVVNGGAGNLGKNVFISAHEMARFGHLMLNRGRWNDRQLISPRWVDEATTVQVPASLPMAHPESGIDGPGCYGFNWRINGMKPDGRLKWPNAPPGTFAAAGYNNNLCFVIPQWKMVIVRLGLDQDDHKITDDEWSEFLGLVGTALVDRDDATVGAGDTRVPRWEPHDFAFRSSARPENPFLSDFTVTVRGPQGVEWTVPGFYDGDGVWKARVAPTLEGRWSIVTRSEIADLDGRQAAFVCVLNPNPRVHGGLRVDPERPHHFLFEDGSRFFLMGYECDWLWALDMTSPSTPRLDAFLDTLVDHGFNYVILNAYAHDTRWRAGQSGEDDYGPPPRYAWKGSNAQPDHNRFQLDYWRHYDRVIEALYRRGIVAHVMIKVYNKSVNWPQRGSAADDLYFRWLLARYAAFPNVVWDFSKEAHNEKDLDYKLDRLKYIREHDPYRRLLTVHDDNAAYDRGAYDGLLDFRADQQHNRWRETLLSQREQNAWPVVNVEFGYEHGLGGIDDKTYRVVQSPEEVCRRAWEVCLAGGYPVYYYTYTAWDVLRPEPTPRGYAYFRNLRRFFEQTGYWQMEPTDGLVSAGHCLARPGREYVVFLNRSQSFELKLEGLAAPLNAKWYHPLTGEWLDAGAVMNGTSRMEPPTTWHSVPVALHVK